ncbi:MAG: glyoxalase [Pedosphaera sp.]|nr:glyoxalase [Pedosphaera sp.]
MITSIAFTVYPVTDMPRARRFYEGDLGFRVETNVREEWIEYDIAGATFAITTMMEKGVPGKGAEIAFEVEDLDIFIEHLKQHNVPFVREVFPTPVCRLAVIADPDGNNIIIHKRHS